MWRPHLAADGIAGLQVELANLRRRHIDVVRTGKVVIVGGAQETVSVGQDFEYALVKNVAFFLSLDLEDLEDKILLSQAARARQIQGPGDLGQLRNVLFFQFSNSHQSPDREMFGRVYIQESTGNSLRGPGGWGLNLSGPPS